MPSPTTIDEFLELVRKSAVADEKRLTAQLDKLRATGSLPTEPGQLAGLLVRDGLLTHFQAEQLLQGKWRRFSIGKYKVLERLGAGGMGSVYLCEHKLMRRRVALKVLPTAKAEDPSSLERFYREARAVAALDHPNIVRAYDIDQEDKLHFLVMEHVDGSSLQEIIKKTGPMDVVRACHYIRQAAMGLQHAHETAGLVHRDIKPGNILIDRNGIVKILDMGLARFFHDEDDILTKKYDENVLGTADYLAPEQALDSHSVDIRADIYSLGATFYFCLTGKTPFAEGTVAQKLIWHQTRQPKSLKSLRPEVPDGVVAIIERMMAKDAGQRYQMPHMVVDALAPWTQTPIPPPPDEEMPQFSLAAMGGPTTETGLSPAGRGVPSGDPSPPPRKVWQVPPSSASNPVVQVAPPATPAPASAQAPAPPAPAPAPPAPQRKTAPPAVPPVAAAPIRPPPVSPAPAPRQAAAPPVKPAANGQARILAAPQPPPPAPALPPSTPDTEEGSGWSDFAGETGIAAHTDTSPRSGRSGRKRSVQIAGWTWQDRRLWWLIGGAVAACALAGLLLWLALRSRPEPSQAVAPARPTIFVNQHAGAGQEAAPTVAAALKHIKERSRLGGTIILQQDVAEEIQLESANVTIESEEGHLFTWKPPPSIPRQKLLTIYNALNCRIRRLTLDGEGREEALVVLSGNCSGTTLEDVKLKGFRKTGVWVVNCKGDPGSEHQVSLLRLGITTDKAEQSGFFFDLNDQLKAIPNNENIVVRDCTVGGTAGVKVKARLKAALDLVDMQPNLLPPTIGQ
jgi:serine/threonine protein kinase